MRKYGLLMFLMATVLILPAARAEALDDLDSMISSTTRLMVFSPHPDDETLGTAGLIQRVIQKGGKVRVVFMTSGDGFTEGVEKERRLQHPTAIDFRRYGKEREQEALHALAVLGLQKEDVEFLGFPDAVLSNLIRKYPCDPMVCRSPFTLITHPPASDIVVRHTDYSGRDLVREVTWALDDFHPNLVTTTPAGGQHPDHCATHYFVAKALRKANRGDPTIKPKFITFLIHYGKWPMGTTENACLDPPAGFPDAEHANEVRWMSLSLSPKEIEVKHRAISQYHSQMLVMDSYMLSFVRPNELFMMEDQYSPQEKKIPWCGKGVL